MAEARKPASRSGRHPLVQRSRISASRGASHAVSLDFAAQGPRFSIFNEATHTGGLSDCCFEPNKKRLIIGCRRHGSKFDVPEQLGIALGEAHDHFDERIDALGRQKIADFS
jgi:hypothetical protein